MTWNFATSGCEWLNFDPSDFFLGHCYYFLCFSLPARVAFSENTKKKKASKSRAAARPHSPLLHDSDFEHRKKPMHMKIKANKGALLSGGGMDDENSKGENGESEFLRQDRQNWKRRP